MRRISVFCRPHEHLQRRDRAAISPYDIGRDESLEKVSCSIRSNRVGAKTAFYK